jgi:hypothetical protein
MGRLLLSALALLSINFAAQAGVVRGILLNDDDPYIVRATNGPFIRLNGMVATLHGFREIASF